MFAQRLEFTCFLITAAPMVHATRAVAAKEASG